MRMRGIPVFVRLSVSLFLFGLYVGPGAAVHAAVSRHLSSADATLPAVFDGQAPAPTLNVAPSPSRSIWRVPETAFLRTETSAQVISVLYRYGANAPGARGAYGSNLTAPKSDWYLEDQRAGGLDVIDGIVRSPQDPGLIAEGLSMFHFGLARENRRGQFPGSVTPFHGTAMFLSEAGPALVMLEDSRLARQFSQELNWQIPRIHKAVYAMVRYVGGPGKIDDATKNHRRFEAAIALGSVGTLTNDKTLIRWSQIYARQGIRMEWTNGIMPEDGGHDSGYQALGMVSAIRYLEMVATGSLHNRLYAAIARGERWLLSRVKADGSINQTGDTRTAGCKERNNQGQCKTVFYDPIYSALAHWAAVTGSAVYENAARRVWERSQSG